MFEATGSLTSTDQHRPAPIHLRTGSAKALNQPFLEKQNIRRVSGRHESAVFPGIVELRSIVFTSTRVGNNKLALHDAEKNIAKQL